MATTKQKAPIHNINIRKTVIVEDIKHNPDDHTITLDTGTYHVSLIITGYRHTTRSRIIDITNNAILTYSGTNIINDDIQTTGNPILIQYLDGREWKPITTLDPDQYSVTLTLK